MNVSLSLRKSLALEAWWSVRFFTAPCRSDRSIIAIWATNKNIIHKLTKRIVVKKDRDSSNDLLMQFEHIVQRISSQELQGDWAVFMELTVIINSELLWLRFSFLRLIRSVKSQRQSTNQMQKPKWPITLRACSRSFPCIWRHFHYKNFNPHSLGIKAFL